MANIIHKQTNKDGSTTFVFQNVENKLEVVVCTSKDPPYIFTLVTIAKEKLRETLNKCFEFGVGNAKKER